jgi:hypothetical protein
MFALRCGAVIRPRRRRDGVGTEAGHQSQGQAVGQKVAAASLGRAGDKLCQFQGQALIPCSFNPVDVGSP